MEAVQRTRSVVNQRSASLVREARLLVVVTLCLLVLTSVPVIYGYLTTPSDQWFSGVVYNVHDTAQYFSWMRESGRALLIENKLTSEPNRPIYFNLHWWIPGRFAALAGLSLPQAYQLSRLFSIPLATTALFLFCARLFPERARRWFAFLLATFTAGLGWVWVVEKYLVYPHTLDFPRDVYTLAGNSLWVMTAAPHLTFALAVTLFTLLLTLEGYRRKQGVWSVGAGFLALFLGMGHIYDLVTIWAVLGVFGLLMTLRDGWSWRTFWRLAVVVLISAPSVLYWGWVASDANPMWKQALAQYDNLGVFTPDPAHLLILLGLTFLVAWLGFFSRLRFWRVQTDEALFIKGWFIVTLVLVYLPLRFQIMLLTGYQLPMAVLATVGLFDHILPWIQDRVSRIRLHHLLTHERLARAIPILFLLAVIPTNLYLLAWQVVVLNRHDYPFYLYRDDVAAMRWLDEHTNPDDVVLSSFTLGHYIPGLAGNKAFLSNAVMTMDFNHKRERVNDFFDSATPDNERLAMIQKYGIRYVFFGLAERALGDYDPSTTSWLTLMFSSPQVDVYSVKPDKLPTAAGSGGTP